jgi:hypothetical protein
MYVYPNSILLKVKDLIFVSSLITSPFGSHPKGLFLFHNLILKIMRTLYKIIIKIASANTNYNRKGKQNNIKGELQSNDIQSLFLQMYSAENDNLFI